MDAKFVLIFLVFFTVTFSLSGQESDSLKVRLTSKYEIGITPRFSGIKDIKISPQDSSFYHYVSLYRMQAGRELFKHQYFHIFGDYYRLRTDLNYRENKIDAFGFGVQYTFKFSDALVNVGPIKLFKKPFTIRWFPELLVSGGLINLKNDTYELSGLTKSTKFHPYFQYGLAWNFYINHWANLSIMYIHEYFFSVQHDFHHYGPLQTKFTIKI